MRYLIQAMLLIVAIIHLLPLSGVLGAERLTVLYGLPINEPNLEILMRHRAVLFGLLGVFFAYAAFVPSYRTLAFVAGFVSVLSFLYLAKAIGNYNAQIARVFVADIVALVALVIGAALHFYAQRNVVP